MPTIFIRDATMRCVLYIKNIQQKFEGIIFGAIYIEYDFCVAKPILIFFLNKRT